MDDVAAPRGDGLDETRRRVRIDLAAAHRLADLHELNEGIRSHFTHRVPGHNDRLYQIPYGIHWSEVTASCFMEVDYCGNRLAGSGEVEPATVSLHAPLHRKLAQAVCVMRAHMPFAATLARVRDARIQPIGQTELWIVGDIFYDDSFSVPGPTEQEGERIAEMLGTKHYMISAGHGALVVGRSVADTYRRLIYLERAAQMQVQALWMGIDVNEIPPEVVKEVGEFSRNAGQTINGKISNADYLFTAMKRVLDRENPGYEN